MTPSLRDLQRSFAASLTSTDALEGGLAVYRNAVGANYRNAMSASYAVVRELTGRPFFDAAVDAFVAAHPSTGGDLNVYGGNFATFLASYPYARDLPYLPDVARLEWAIDEATRAADSTVSPQRTVAALAALGADDLMQQRFTVDPSCRLLRSDFPVLRIWQAHGAEGDRDFDIDFDVPADHLLIRREGNVPVVERMTGAEHEWLAALQAGHALNLALEAAFARDAEFDVGAMLGKHIASGAIGVA